MQEGEQGTDIGGWVVRIKWMGVHGVHGWVYMDGCTGSNGLNGWVCRIKWTSIGDGW